MAPKQSRPISVWIAQIILGLYGSGTILLIVWGLYKGLTEGIPNPQLYVVTNVGVLTFAALFTGGFWGMALRKSWGRWLGVAGMTILLIGGAITQTSRWISDKDASIFSIGFVYSVLVVVGLAVLIYLVAAGDAADRFFEGSPTKVRKPEL